MFPQILFGTEQIEICLSGMHQSCKWSFKVDKFLKAIANINTSDNQYLANINIIYLAVWYFVGNWQTWKE